MRWRELYRRVDAVRDVGQIIDRLVDLANEINDRPAAQLLLEASRLAQAFERLRTPPWRSNPRPMATQANALSRKQKHRSTTYQKRINQSQNELINE